VVSVRLTHERLDTRGVREAAALSARAYRNDPFFAYVYATAPYRERSIENLHRAVFAPRSVMRRTVVARDLDGVIVGVALWVAPGGFPPSLTEQLRQTPRNVLALRGHRGALARGMSYQHQVLASHPREAHWYLWSLTVDPSVQGHGIGTQLVVEGLQVADHDHVGVHLETQNPDNLGFYERFGFTRSHVVQPLPTAPPLFAMWRNAH